MYRNAIVFDKVLSGPEHVGTIMLTQVNSGREQRQVLAPIEIPPQTLTSARFAAIKAAGAIDTAG